MKTGGNAVPKYTGIHPDGNDFAFVLANFFPITKDEVLQRNPHLESWANTSEKKFGKPFDEMLETHFYSCVNLDDETGRCKIHDNLPRVCSEYPWYGNEPDQSFDFYTEDCFYKRDLLPQ